MGFVRTSLSIILSSLLFVSLLLLSIFAVLQWSSNYNVLQPQAVSYSKNLISEGSLFNLNFNDAYSDMQKDCIGRSNYIVNEGDIHLEIPCDVVNQGMDSVVDYGLNNSLHTIYYKNYSCDFLNCIQQQGNPLFLVSEKSHSFLKSIFYTLLLISIVLFIFLFLCVRKKSNSFITAGILMIVVSLIIKSIDFLLVFFNQPLIKGVIGLFFSKSHAIFLIFLIGGIFLLLTGIFIKALKIEIKIAERFSKGDKKKVDDSKVRKIVDDEVQKEIKKEKFKIKKKKR